MGKIVGKIIDINPGYVYIGADNGKIHEARKVDLNFEPRIGDEVEVYKNEYRTIVTKAEKKSDTVNSNSYDNNYSSLSGGRIVNKWVYVLLAIFLGCFGIQYFYAGRMGAGIACVLFSWTGIPGLIGLFVGIAAMLKTPDADGNIEV